VLYFFDLNTIRKDDKLMDLGTTKKKTTEFEPSDAPALTYAEFDPSSARFAKYKD
jgi:hypothetical protein